MRRRIDKLVIGLTLWFAACCLLGYDEPPFLAIAPFDSREATAHQEAWAHHLGVDVEITHALGMRFRLIPPGEFLMGSPDDEEGRWTDEGPQHRVRISRPFFLGVHPVTQSQWESVMGSNPSDFSSDGLFGERVSRMSTGDFPVDSVSWGDTQSFLKKLNEQATATGGVYRLPTEAEWEYACRAGTTTRFYFGDDPTDLDEFGWYSGNTGGWSDGRPHRVGVKRPNAWGIYDLHGNVWEWCQDRLSGDYETNSPREDPTGPPTGSYRVNRGGSWDEDAEFCRSASRGGSTPGRRRNDLGFRLVLSVVRTGGQ